MASNDNPVMLNAKLIRYATVALNDVQKLFSVTNQPIYIFHTAPSFWPDQINVSLNDFANFDQVLIKSRLRDHPNF